MAPRQNANPSGIRNVIDYPLGGAHVKRETYNRTFDIGGTSADQQTDAGMGFGPDEKN